MDVSPFLYYTTDFDVPDEYVSQRHAINEISNLNLQTHSSDSRFCLKAYTDNLLLKRQDKTNTRQESL